MRAIARLSKPSPVEYLDNCGTNHMRSLDEFVETNAAAPTTMSDNVDIYIPISNTKTYSR